MALEVKTIDEELKELVDEYDRYIAPYSVYRNNNNKLYLIFRSIAAGFSKIRDVVLALKYRFDPRYASDDDLESAMYITGEQSIPGKASIVRITVRNDDLTDQAIMTAGVYQYVSADGEPFNYTLEEDYVMSPKEYTVILFSSANIGAFFVAGEAVAAVTRQDGGKIDERLVFGSLNNASSMGNLPESTESIRTRLLTDTTRQDSLTELQTAIRSLPSIFSADLVFNAKHDEIMVLEDGTNLPPKTLLIVITGVPTKELAELVCSKTVYNTYMAVSSQVVWYENDIFAGGKYPVYYTNHTYKGFYICINYQYDQDKLKQEQVEAIYWGLLNKYRSMVTHIDEINEPLLYADVAADLPSGVKLKKIYLQEMRNGKLTSVAEVIVPKLSIPRLEGLSFVAEGLL